MAVSDEGYSRLSVSDEGYSRLSVSDEGYSRNTSCAVDEMSMFLLLSMAGYDCCVGLLNDRGNHPPSVL